MMHKIYQAYVTLTCNHLLCKRKKKERENSKRRNEEETDRPVESTEKINKIEERPCVNSDGLPKRLYPWILTVVIGEECATDYV